jgi:polysaccharide biosynthesis/export protein
MDRSAFLSRRALIFLPLVLFVSLGYAAQVKKESSSTAPPAPRAEDEALRKAVGAPVDPQTYTIGAEDILNVNVWREQALSGPVGVRPDGRITLPLIGDMQAGGLTPAALTMRITEGFKGAGLLEPVVMVSVAQVNSKKYFISGEVQRPGSFPLVVPTTVLEALAIAGGFRDYANTKKILVMRGPKRLTFNYKDIVRGKKLAQNILLENGDHIVVP